MSEEKKQTIIIKPEISYCSNSVIGFCGHRFFAPHTEIA